MRYTTVIGLEIHAELTTNTKVFCSCTNSFAEEKNTCCCPSCTALPGALPVLNKGAVEMIIAAGLELGCEIAEVAKWDRKNYFYPDLPKAYQISQLYAPVCIGGGLKIDDKFIRLNHIHLEEDAGKLLHLDFETQMDYNRAGVPLIEIVSEPDMRSSDEAIAFVKNIRRTLVYAGVCDGKMEQGSLRVDANISIMPEGSNVFGTRAEIKNINSFRFMKAAIEFEIERQKEILESGGQVIQETRRYDAAKNQTFSMRSKENAHDYRYFPDPDIPAIVIPREEVERIRATLAESPEKRFERYTGEFGLSIDDAEVILDNKLISDYYDAVVKMGADARAVANSIKGELMRLYNLAGKRTEILIQPIDFARGVQLALDGKISQAGLKTAIGRMFEENVDLETVIREEKLIIEEDLELLEVTIDRVIAENPAQVEQYHNGKTNILGYLVGQCAKIMQGKAHPKTINEAMRRRLDA